MSRISVAGVDYSLTSPGVCVFMDSISATPTFQKCTHYFRNSTKRHDAYHGHKIFGSNHPEHKNEQERYSNLTDWVMEILKDHEVDRVFIEGYSYGSSGKVFHIAENTAILKDRMWQKSIPFHTIAPSAVKKAATGKGNANKEKMHQAFQDECNIDLVGTLTPKASKIISPVADIVDAYFILKHGWSTL